MKIWIVSDGEPLPIDGEDIRLRRMGNLARILSERGHEVIWFSSNFEHYTKRFRSDSDKVINVNDNYKIVLLSTKGYKRNVSLDRYIHFKTLASKFRILSLELNKPDVIVNTMAPIEIANEIKNFSENNNVKYIVDIRDLWPDIYYEVTPKFIHFAVSFLIKKTRKDLSLVLKNSAGIVGVTEKFLEYGLNVANINKRDTDKVFHTAYPSYTPRGDFKEYWEKYGVEKEDFIVSFVGNFGKQFDLETVFATIDRFKNSDIKFVLCGLGENYDFYLNKYKNNDNVILPGWIGKEEITTLLINSDIGIAPYINSKNYRLNLPNKFGEYLASKLPILVSVTGMMESVLTQFECGYKYDDDFDLYNKITHLFENKEILNRQKENAFRLYEEQFKVEKVYNGFADYLENRVNE
ncbi:glycosyltransferase family 4 protein [Staphylococcus xylosus]|uniref:glycosyltransferase family 4 protein n=1 Tax=Staphylococcus xylosus TaxID=1288 RepID=UPI002DBFB5ED|nr:glycosyltransferase family 4 protein [Staphylococcus xylosus]MEB8187611.1 glycosyltransferase family 4 protein [Staphylococcus xylosus]